MCFECYKAAGKPAIINEKTIYAAALVSKVYEFSNAGGHAHNVIDDWNLDDSNINWCIKLIDENDEKTDTNPLQIEAELECLMALSRLTDDERASAMALHEGFIDASTISGL